MGFSSQRFVSLQECNPQKFKGWSLAEFYAFDFAMQNGEVIYLQK